MKQVKKIKSSRTKWLAIRKALKYASERDLLGLINELYVLSLNNKNLLEARFLREETNLEKYKDHIKRYLALNEPWKESQKISIKEAKKALGDYKKAIGDKIGLIELTVYYVECGTNFLCDFGNMYESYYSNLELVFQNALNLSRNMKTMKLRIISIA